MRRCFLQKERDKKRRKGTSFRIALVLFSGFFLFSESLAVPALPEAQRLQENLLLQEQDRQKEDQRQRWHKKPPRFLPPRLGNDPASVDFPVSFTFETILFQGSTRLLQEEQKKLQAPYLQRTISLEDINQLLKDVTQAYLDKGYATTRVYIGAQDLSSGRLILHIREGKVASVHWYHRDGNADEKEHAIPSSLRPFRKGDLLNLRDLENVIDHVTRLQTYEIHSDITPASQDGESHVTVRTQQERPFSLRLSREGDGTRKTGLARGNINVTLEDLLGIYERISGTYRRDLDFQAGHHFSHSLTLQASVPYQAWLFRYMASFFRYRSTLQGQAFEYQLEGATREHRGEALWTFHRDGVSKTALISFFSHRKTASYIEGERLHTGLYTLNTAGMGLSQGRRLGKSVLSGTGMAILSQKRSPDLGSEDPDHSALFPKYTLDIDDTCPFKIEEEEMLWSLQGHGQYAPRDVASLDRFSLGSATTVRGFRETQLSGNTGFWGRCEVAWTFFRPDSSWQKRLWGSFQIFQGVDYGWIRPHPEDPYERGKLLSATIGVRFGGRFLWGDVAASTSLSAPSFLEKEPHRVILRIGAVL